ncbi:TdeIII family type II restriction endonuclease [Candidatus Poribacteria bacterium]|nr:TdeIII family type II restriction endonuclease [Candidatus Poribacteria bacterium]
MPSISPNTRPKIRGCLDALIESTIDEFRHRRLAGRSQTEPDSGSKKGELKPFHEALLPVELDLINRFERSISTKLGTTIEECARLIALDHHREAHTRYKISGMVSRAGLVELERQRSVFEQAAEQKGHKPSLGAMVSAVLDASRDDDLVSRVVTADLHIVARDGREFFFEIKSPKANKDQCMTIIERVLRIHLFRGKARPEVNGYFAMAYNPFGANRDDYQWSFVRNYYPMDDGLLIGDEFWKLIGGPTCYAELLDIYREVGAAMSKRVLDALFYGF